MKKLFVLSLLVVLFASGCSLFGNAGKSTDMNSVPTNRTIDIKNSVFMPSTSSIKAGDSVTWTNQDTFAHSIKADDFSSSELTTGQTYTFTFKKKGTYEYVCDLHPNMKGKIVVE
ncbi:MAG: Blue (Type 1) copper domain protein [Parcubacteria group bacterium GW2011_GWE2_39_37]|uniref:Blue (Type 1) copper domain protein n=1 Tax=Candidatus Falkowbacteria bacterium GW2011_GWF2_39_8 TaxID=1618642 RepID=A0A0G0SF38_9BACT|nr:MAG: Blue (Type 1) copper domain protein [Parcubacteria group bacterium GW2011_GWE2_39_37]KKR33330.1 MAG: Blue (Type 1) copper domain protein [Candidatus Falkowbacteria bacterium GW2011_GWF2_39_8]